MNLFQLIFNPSSSNGSNQQVSAETHLNFLEQQLASLEEEQAVREEVHTANLKAIAEQTLPTDPMALRAHVNSLHSDLDDLMAEFDNIK